MRRKIVVVVKGYPRLSETFIAQELLGLEQAGLELVIVALRRPTERKRHPVHDEIGAAVHYLPEYLHEEPLRVLRALAACLPTAGFWRALAAFAADLAHDPTRNRVRRFGQALVLAAEWPAGGEWLHAHFIHTPPPRPAMRACSPALPGPARRMPRTSGRRRTAISRASWSRRAGRSPAPRAASTHLRRLAGERGKVHLSHHGLDLVRFGPFGEEHSDRDGSDAGAPVLILSVGRAVDKKGFDILLQALARLPADLHWRFEHIGGGELLGKLRAQADELGIADRISWKGGMAQDEVLARYRQADIFALACRISGDGDRDGLPNVLVEASSQRLTCISTTISGVPELLSDGENGLLVPPEDPAALASALERAIRDPQLRKRLGAEAETKVRTKFDYHSSIRQLTALFEQEWQATP